MTELGGGFENAESGCWLRLVKVTPDLLGGFLWNYGG
jgi:hypothetical protein